MAPFVEVGHVWVCVVDIVISGVIVDFIVVHAICKHRRSLAGIITSTNVLSVAATISGRVVSIDTTLRDHLSCVGKAVIPNKIFNGVVESVVVVLC